MRVIANYGAMHPVVEGEITRFNNGVAFFYDVNDPEMEYSVNVDNIKYPGEKSANGSPIGVFYKEE